MKRRSLSSTKRFGGGKLLIVAVAALGVLATASGITIAAAERGEEPAGPAGPSITGQELLDGAPLPDWTDDELSVIRKVTPETVGDAYAEVVFYPGVGIAPGGAFLEANETSEARLDRRARKSGKGLGPRQFLSDNPNCGNLLTCAYPDAAFNGDFVLFWDNTEGSDPWKFVGASYNNDVASWANNRRNDSKIADGSNGENPRRCLDSKSEDGFMASFNNVMSSYYGTGVDSEC